MENTKENSISLRFVKNLNLKFKIILYKNLYDFNIKMCLFFFKFKMKKANLFW